MSSLLRTAIATIAINSLIWQPFVLSAQEIQAMGGTNVGQTSYGVPLININAPSASGVSQNQYQNFNVNSYGAVFNNATQDTTTVIGGDIRANKNFNGSSAKIILNEVKGTSASNLNGYMEVGGDKADVVIANPNGITCNGCGYVNTANATLTTGSAQMDNGAITGYNVQGGTITINGDGLDASRTDKADLISRAVKLNASIYANKLNVKTGANNPSTPAPNVSIDSAALGGMYANSINIQGTENGVGINLPEAVVSGSGGVTINANGKITVANVSSAGDVTIHAKAADIDVKADKQVRSMQQASLTGDNVQLSSGSAIVTGQQLSIRANNITNKGDLTAGVGADDLFQAGGNISIDASNAVHNQGKAFATSAINVRAKSLVNEDQLLSMGAQTLLIDEAAANRGEMSAGGDLEVSANNIDNQGKISSGASVAVSAVSAVQNLGEIEANNTITIEADKVLNNQSSSDGEGLLSAGIVYINAAKSADIGASINAQILNIASEGDVTAKSDINANIINVTANNVALVALAQRLSMINQLAKP